MEGSVAAGEKQGWPEVFRRAPLSVALATWFGCGFLPLVPGTWGSLATLPVALLAVSSAGVWGLAAFAGFASLAGIPAAGRVAALSGRHDPSQIVIDEVAGQSIGLLGVYVLASPSRPPLATAALVAASFVGFRILDILKPGPVRRLEGLPGGLGVMADDIAAGAITALVLAAARGVLGW